MGWTDSLIGAYEILISTPVSFHYHVCGFDDWRPTGNFALHELGERPRTSPCLARNLANISEALAYALVIECLIEGISEPMENRLRDPLRRKKRPPSQPLKFRQASLPCTGYIRQVRMTFSCTNCICLNGPCLNVLTDLVDSVGHVIDLTADQRIQQEGEGECDGADAGMAHI